jgi:hypothetical protein
MRKALLLAGLLTVLALAIYGGPTVASASQTCTEPCSGGSTLSCTVATGMCTSSLGSVTCCGATHDCAAINTYDTCRNNCETAYDTCINHCTVRNPCVQNCNNARTTCLSHCGTRPTTSWSC